MKIELKCADEHWSEYMEEVTVEITQEILDLVRRAQYWLEANRQYSQLKAWHYAVEDYGCRTECEEINITTDQVWWSGYVKHINVKLYTESVTRDAMEKEFAASQN